MEFFKYVYSFLSKLSNLVGLGANLFIHYPILKNSFYLRYYLRKLKYLKNRSDIKKIFDFISLGKNFIDFLFLGTGIVYTDQLKNEILPFLKFIEDYKPRYILEIGTAGGGSLFLFSQIATKDAVILSVDLPYGIHGGGYSEWKIPIYKAMIRKNQTVHLIRADSHKRSTLNRVKRILNGEKLDFLFIDGDHTYDGVREDFETYSPLVRKNGLIAFHDIVKHPSKLKCEVDKFWNEIKENYDYKVFVENWSQQKAGIGVIKYKK